MITSLRMTDFKNFADETLHVGPFTLIVGANASGKSNIRDAFRFLQGIGRGYMLPEIVGGKYGADWKPIRGSAGTITRFGASKIPGASPFALEAQMCVRLASDTESPREVTYRAEAHHDALGHGGLLMVSERLQADSERSYWGPAIKGQQLGGGAGGQPTLLQDHMMHSGPNDWEYDCAKAVCDQFNRMRFFDFVPEHLRETGAPGNTTLGDNGDNFPTVLQKICADSSHKAVLIDWIRELTPMDVTDLEFHPDASRQDTSHHPRAAWQQNTCCKRIRRNPALSRHARRVARRGFRRTLLL